MLKGAIFDFDGTLFDSMGVWDTVGIDYLKSLHRKPKPGLNQIVKTMSLYQAACYCQREYDIPLTVQEIMDGFNRVVEGYYFDIVQPKPGVIDFLERLQAAGVKMCIATATDRYLIEAALRRCGMLRFFLKIFTCTEIGRGKDDPVIFRKAIEFLGTERGNTLVFEDVPHAIETAQGDGFLVAGVYDRYEENTAFVREISDIYLADFCDLEQFWQYASGL